MFLPFGQGIFKAVEMDQAEAMATPYPGTHDWNSLSSWPHIFFQHLCIFWAVSWSASCYCLVCVLTGLRGDYEKLVWTKPGPLSCALTCLWESPCGKVEPEVKREAATNSYHYSFTVGRTWDSFPQSVLWSVTNDFCIATLFLCFHFLSFGTTDFLKS